MCGNIFHWNVRWRNYTWKQYLEVVVRNSMDLTQDWKEEDKFDQTKMSSAYDMLDFIKNIDFFFLHSRQSCPLFFPKCFLLFLEFVVEGVIDSSDLHHRFYTTFFQLNVKSRFSVCHHSNLNTSLTKMFSSLNKSFERTNSIIETTAESNVLIPTQQILRDT